MTKMTTLGRIGSIRLGHHFRTSIQSAPEGNVTVLQMKDISENGEIAWNGLTRVIEQKDKSFVKKDEIVFAHRGNRNYSALIDRDTQNVLASGNLFVICVSDPSVLPAYLNWYLNQEPAQKFFEHHREGSYIPMLRAEWLKVLELPIPPLEVQKTIVLAHKTRSLEKELEKKLRERRDLIIRHVIYKKIGLTPGGKSE